MAIKTRLPHQYQIIQLILNNIDFVNMTDEEFSKLTKNEVVIGYLFRRVTEKFGANRDTLNIYCINSKYCKQNEIVSLSDLQTNYKNWLNNCKVNSVSSFKNPPVINWLDTKEQWVTKLAARISKTFNITFDDAKSHIYYAISKAYNKGTVYIGNLGYIERSAYNEVLMDIRYNKKRLNLDNEKVVSFDTIVPQEDEDTRLSDVLGENDSGYNECEFNELKAILIKELSKAFSPREIEQILTLDNQATSLPYTIYRRLIQWRQKHKRSDFDV